MDVDFDVEVVALSGGAGTVSEHDARARHPAPPARRLGSRPVGVAPWSAGLRA
ncbi:hypothetical protein O980_22275 [Mycobacterium avium subsp. paratuberculosis 08-8281]|nr:hypothetical protein O980_22275 [Mycobacterium avium subsp. paratuberculosis 08-8281]